MALVDGSTKRNGVVSKTRLRNPERSAMLMTLCQAEPMHDGFAQDGVEDVDRGRQWLRRDARRASRPGADLDARVARRLSSLVDRSRTLSPLFSELYADIDNRVTLQGLPVTTKPMLLDRFDEWCTDRAVTRAAIDEFIADTGNVGQRFLGEYLCSESSGTSGVTGLFVTEESAVTVAAALGVRNRRPPPTAVVRLMAKRMRTALIINLKGHHMGAAFYSSRTVAGADSRVRFMSVFDPIDTLAEQLTRFDPACISSYASVVVLLAREQLAGRLSINPAVVLPFSETITAEALQLMQRAWPHAQIIDRYVSNECMFISARCAHRWHHLNADWVILEPVDAEYNPVPPGTQSHTVLLTNLFRRVQPIIRYDLGDSIVMRPDPCPCGNPLPAFDVVGRSGELLNFTAAGRLRGISPTVISVTFDETPGVALWQVVRDSPMHLTARISVEADHDAEAVAQDTRRRLTEILVKSGLSTVSVDVIREPPVRNSGGKLVRIVDAHR